MAGPVYRSSGGDLLDPANERVRDPVAEQIQINRQLHHAIRQNELERILFWTKALDTLQDAIRDQVSWARAGRPA